MDFKPIAWEGPFEIPPSFASAELSARVACVLDQWRIQCPPPPMATPPLAERRVTRHPAKSVSTLTVSSASGACQGKSVHKPRRFPQIADELFQPVEALQRRRCKVAAELFCCVADICPVLRQVVRARAERAITCCSLRSQTRRFISSVFQKLDFLGALAPLEFGLGAGRPHRRERRFQRWVIEGPPPHDLLCLRLRARLGFQRGQGRRQHIRGLPSGPMLQVR